MWIDYCPESNSKRQAAVIKKTHNTHIRVCNHVRNLCRKLVFVLFATTGRKSAIVRSGCSHTDSLVTGEGIELMKDRDYASRLKDLNCETLDRKYERSHIKFFEFQASV